MIYLNLIEHKNQIIKLLNYFNLVELIRENGKDEKKEVVFKFGRTQARYIYDGDEALMCRAARTNDKNI